MSFCVFKSYILSQPIKLFSTQAQTRHDLMTNSLGKRQCSKKVFSLKLTYNGKQELYILKINKIA